MKAGGIASRVHQKSSKAPLPRISKQAAVTVSGVATVSPAALRISIASPVPWIASGPRAPGPSLVLSLSQSKDCRIVRPCDTPAISAPVPAYLATCRTHIVEELDIEPQLVPCVPPSLLVQVAVADVMAGAAGEQTAVAAPPPRRPPRGA